MKKMLENNLGKLLVICVIIVITLSNVLAKSDEKTISEMEEAKIEGNDGPGPSCNC